MQPAILYNKQCDKYIIYFYSLKAQKLHENNAILDELNSFAFSIKNDERPKVDICDGHNALDVAIRIIKNFK